VVIIYALTLFISAFLLFWVQLWVGKLLLPLLGGAPGVWNTCMVFFQALLLFGYSYAHILSTRIAARYQAIVHTLFLLIPLSLLPLSLPSAISPPRDTNPIFWLLGILVITVGLPSLAIATTAPLMQRWFAIAQKNNDPYFLYAASNIGSLLSLVSYPVLIETNFSLSQQSYLWAGGYGILASLTGICAINIWKSAAPEQLFLLDDSSTLDNNLDNKKDNNLDNKKLLVSTNLSLDPQPSKSQQFRWIILGFLPTSLLLGTTTYITTDIAAVPLFWAIPLIVYLSTFILAFTNNSLINQQFNYQKLLPLLPALLTALVISFLLQLMRPIALLVPLHLLGLFFVGYICHGELASDRPKPNYLTLFYFWISVGGVAGGIFNAIISPLLFTSVLEYPSVLIISFLLLPKLVIASNSGIISQLTPELISKLTADLTSNLNSDLNSEKSISKSISELIPKPNSQVNNSSFRFSVPISLGLILATLIVGFSPRFVWSDWLGIILVIILWLGIYKTFNLSKIRLLVGLLLLSLLGQFSLTTMGQVLVRDRSFFGIYRVVSQQQGQYYSLFHGTTLHGKQSRDSQRRDEPLTYFSATGPIGQVFNYFSRKDTFQNSHIAVLGLGVGTLFSYARSPQEWTFYEIDPVVVKLATDPKYFSFLGNDFSNSPEVIKKQIILGDGRLQLAKAQDDYYDLLVMDAFSSDAIPTHLVTLEAMELYLQKLRKNGIIAVNISNRFINLEPVLAKLAQELNLVSYSQVDRAITPLEKEQGKTASHWVIMARNQEYLGSLITDFPWQNMSTQSNSKFQVWTDDFSDIWQVLKLNEKL
jgi:hypothetical protein